MKTNRHTVRLTLLSSLVTLSLALPSSVNAEEKTWEIMPNDTLGAIVAKQYPNYSNRNAIMQAILNANPNAFIGNNINRLIVGKTLILPEASSIPGVKPPAATTADAGVDKATLRRLEALEAERKEMEETLKLLEEENAALQDMVKNYEESKQAKDAEFTQLTDKLKALESKLAASATSVAPTNSDTEAEALATLKADIATLQTENTQLKEQLNTAQQALKESTTAMTGLKTQLDELKNQNTLLNNDLQQAHALVSIAEKKSSGSNWLPWTLLGLLSLLMLPLLWILKRNREEPRIKTVIAPPAPTPVIPEPKPSEPVSYSDTSTPPVSSVVTPEREVEIPAGTIPENPDAELKLDIARAYLDLREPEAAAEILREVITEGGSRQQQEAKEILSFLG